MDSLIMQSLQPKAPVDSRSGLTTIQITDTQKESIDQAYSMYANEQNKVTKGEFLEILAHKYMSENGRHRSVLPVPESNQPSLV